MKVALVYDRVNKWGGAERVLLALHKIFPKAPLYTSVYHPKSAVWAKKFVVKKSFLQIFPKASVSHELYAPLMPFAFESFSFDEYDLVISVTSEAAKGIITGKNTIHICYCLTPTRYIWSGYDEYFKNPYFRFFSLPVIFYLKKWDKLASKRPDFMIAISGEVKNRIERFYGRKAEIIHPPVELSFQRSLPPLVKAGIRKGAQKKEMKAETDFFLVVSRLIPYKRIDIAIAACNKLALPLKIIGKGSQEKKLREISGPTIEFLGELTDRDLTDYYKNCKALIFPGIEDFGLVMVEAQSFGKPVIAFKGGGALDIVKEGITGEFFTKQNKQSLIKVLKKFDKRRYNSLLCKQNAKRFAFSKFERQIKSFIKKNIKKK